MAFLLLKIPSEWYSTVLLIANLISPCCFIFLSTYLYILKVVAKGMIDRASPGSIVNVSSQASSRALKDHTVYCSTKGALDQLTRVMALELGPHKVSYLRFSSFDALE